MNDALQFSENQINASIVMKHFQKMIMKKR